MQNAMVPMSAPIESTLPRPWEDERGFNDALYEWMQRAPWLALSALAHGLLFLVLLAIPWDLLQQRDERVIQAELAPETVDPFEEPDPPPVEPLDVPVPTDEPALVSDDSIDEPTSDAQDEPSDATSEDFLSDFPSDLTGDLGVIGIGGGWSGGNGHLGHGRGPGKRGRGTEQTVEDGLIWLREHQARDGHWSSAGFASENALGRVCACDGPGLEVHDVGVTGLALLAFLGDGHTTRSGIYRDNVTRALAWLRDQQDRDSGLIGTRSGHTYMYDHAIAALALCEAYYFAPNPLLRSSAQAAVDFVLMARNPYSAWRYDSPPLGESDTSITGWMVMVLTSAEEGGLRIDRTAYAGALSWLDEVSDPATGRAGYLQVGSLSSRIPRVNEHFPPEKGEAMTAVALLSRFLLGQEPRSLGGSDDIMDRHAELLAARLPEWDPSGLGNDMYYWYYGSYAMYQMGGSRHWEPWNKALKRAAVGSQRRDGDAKGSWDPIGPWGMQGGRVYSTALMVLTLEVYYRYSRVIGAR